jgi:hypothetical protein
VKLGFPHEYLFKDVSPATLASKKARGVCRHFGCNRAARSGASDCETCKSRKQRLANRTMYAFTMLRSSAAKRKIPFKLSFDDFVEFDRKTGYVEKMGRGSDDLTCDRIDSSKPYELGNIRALTYRDNVSKKLEGMEQPCDPIAKLIHGFSGSKANWRAFRAQAGEILELVERLQGYHQDEEPEDESNPF